MFFLAQLFVNAPVGMLAIRAAVVDKEAVRALRKPDFVLRLDTNRVVAGSVHSQMQVADGHL